MTKTSPISSAIRCGIFAAAALLFCAPGVRAAMLSEAALEDELRVADQLATQWSMGDFATKLLEELTQKTAQTQRVNAVRVTIFAMAGKFTEAETLMTQMGKSEDAQEARLRLAYAYAMRREFSKAKMFYQEYFKQVGKAPTGAGPLRIYRDACGMYGAIMKLAGDLDEAIAAGQRYLDTKPDQEHDSAARIDMAVLLIDLAKKDAAKKNASVDRALAMVKEVEMRGFDYDDPSTATVFGQAVVAHANALLAKGERVKALQLIKQEMDILTPVDTALKESKEARIIDESPMAGVRYMRGLIYQADAEAAVKEGNKAKAMEAYVNAVREFIQVFVEYGGSPYGVDAGLRANTIKALLESKTYGKTVKWKMNPDQMERLLEQSYALADRKMGEQSYDEAIAAYLKILNDYPESRRSVVALGALAKCYVEKDDVLMAKTVMGYIGERFQDIGIAGDQLRTLAKLFFDRAYKRATNDVVGVAKDMDQFYFASQAFVDNFPKHTFAPSVLYTLGSLKETNNAGQPADPKAAAEYYDRIVKNYTNDAFYSKALARVGVLQVRSSNYLAAAESYERYAASLEDGFDQIQARMNMADALRRGGKPIDALPIYDQLITKLRTRQSLAGATVETQKRSKDLLESAVYQRAVCLSRITEPKEQLAEYRDKAIAALDAFVKEFPNSTNYAPSALSVKGSVYLQMDKSDEAFAVFQELSTRYPQSDVGRDALISMVASALTINKVDQAQKAFQQMMSGSGNLKVRTEQYVAIGQLFLDNNCPNEAAQAFAQVIGKTEERRLLERSLFGRGMALVKTAQYAEAAKALEELFKRYENTGYYFEGTLALVTAYRETGKYDAAVAKISEVIRQPRSTREQKARAEYELGQIFEKKKDLLKASAGYQKMVELAAMSEVPERDTGVLAVLEKAALSGIAVNQELKRWDKVMDFCDNYTTLFPNASQADKNKIRAWRAEANSNSTSAPAAPVTPPATPAAPAAGATPAAGK